MSLSSIENDFSFAVSPLEQAAAYEAWWDKAGTTVKNVAEACKRQPTAILSELINAQERDIYLQRLKTLMAGKRLDFELCFAGDAEYPPKLRDAKYPVPLFYYQGAWDLIYSPSVAVVGTRKPSAAGEKRTIKLVHHLVKDGFTVMSGLAQGIDTVAHETAIGSDGKTIAVIGTPLSEYYPKQNKALQDLIAKRHLLISQVPFFRYGRQTYRENRFFFPERNKTMSALSLATVIVEASETSGALIQARAALEQGRKLFILDSCFENTQLTWPARFHQQGAIRVKDYLQIHEALRG